MRNLIIGLLAAVMLAVGALSAAPKLPVYEGPQITAIVVHKATRRMFLVAGEAIVRAYDIDLGFAPEGHKAFEGDGKTPEGAYRIFWKNENSEYHLSLGISYPNTRDRAAAAALGKSPGGDIFIHGTPNGKLRAKDWTYGCIAVTNSEVEEIFAMVETGTPIFIHP
jgi:murein L,D-transpeptidase YafK